MATETKKPDATKPETNSDVKSTADVDVKTPAPKATVEQVSSKDVFLAMAQGLYAGGFAQELNTIAVPKMGSNNLSTPQTQLKADRYLNSMSESLARQAAVFAAKFNNR